MKWVFYLVIFVYMFNRAVYGAKPKELNSISIESKGNGDENYLRAGVRKTISCKVSSKNQKVEWLDPSGHVVKRLPSERVFAQEHFVQSLRARTPALVLIFTHAIVEDTGVWECRSGELTQNISVCVIDPAEFVDTPTEVTVDQGRSITLSCQARGEPEPRLLWYRNGIVITDDDSSSKYKVMTKYNSQGFEGLLTVTSLERDDSGVYTCDAIQESPLLEDCTNSQSLNITLHVNYAPVFEDDNDTMIVYGKKNENVQLVCTADGYPAPTYRWFTEIGDILSEVPHDHIKFLEDGTQAIWTLKVNSSTFGQRYRCRATNMHGDAFKIFTIMKLERPQKPSEISVYNSTHNQIQFNVTWYDETLFPIDSVNIQYIKKENLVKKKSITPKEADWKKGIEKEVEFDDKEAVDSDFEGLLVTLTDLNEQTEYWVRLRVVNSAGESPWSDPVLVATTELEEVTEEQISDTPPTSGDSDATFYGIFFAGGIMVLAIVCVFAMRMV